MVWPIKPALATPRVLYIIVITSKIGLGKPGYHAVIASDSALCMECINMSGPRLKSISIIKMASKVTTYLLTLMLLIIVTSTYSLVI